MPSPIEGLKISPLKVTIFTLLPSLAFLLLCDLSTRWWFHCSLWDFTLSVVSDERAPERTIFEKPLAQFDPVVGYNCIPGRHRIMIVKGRRSIVYRATIGQNGYRATSSNPAAYTGKPEIWIQGCSYAWGLGVNDEDTFSWQVQQGIPDMRVRNLGGNGYGTIQALLQLRDGVAHAALPRIAVVVYNGFHLPRNVAAPSFLQMMNGAGDAFLRSKAALPAASLNGQSLQVRMLPLLFAQANHGGADPDADTQRRVANAILAEIYGICRERQIQPVFAVQSRIAGDRVVERARELGFTIADLAVDLDERAGRQYRLWPVDMHPNPAAHREYATRLLKTLRAIRQAAPGAM